MAALKPSIIVTTLLVLILSPLPAGGNLLWARGTLAVVAALLLLATAVDAQYRQRPWRCDFFHLVLALASGVAVLQLLPSNASWLAQVSPTAAARYADLAPLAITASVSRISLSPYWTRDYLVLLLIVAAFYTVIRHFFRDRKALLLLAWSIVGAALLNTVIALISTGGESTRLFWYLRPHSSGLVGTFLNKNHFALLQELALPIAAGLGLGLFTGKTSSGAAAVALTAPVTAATAATRRLLLLRLASILALVYTMIGLLLSYSRAGIAAGVFALLLLGTISLRRRRQRLAILGLWFVGIGMTAGLFWVNDELFRVASKYESIVEQRDVSGRVRLQIWRDTLPLLRAYWQTGVGFGAYAFVSPRYESAVVPDRFAQHAHNDWLEFFCEVGVPAALLILTLTLLFIAGSCWRLRRQRDAQVRCLGTGAALALLAVAIHSAFDYGLRSPGNALLATAALALLANCAEFDRDRRRSRRRSDDRQPRDVFDVAPSNSPAKKVFERGSGGKLSSESFPPAAGGLHPVPVRPDLARLAAGGRRRSNSGKHSSFRGWVMVLAMLALLVTATSYAWPRWRSAPALLNLRKQVAIAKINPERSQTALTRQHILALADTVLAALPDNVVALEARALFAGRHAEYLRQLPPQLAALGHHPAAADIAFTQPVPRQPSDVVDIAPENSPAKKTLEGGPADKGIVLMPTVRNWGKPFEKGYPPNPLPKLFNLCSGEHYSQKSLWKGGPGEEPFFRKDVFPRPPEAIQAQIIKKYTIVREGLHPVPAANPGLALSTADLLAAQAIAAYEQLLSIVPTRADYMLGYARQLQRPLPPQLSPELASARARLSYELAHQAYPAFGRVSHAAAVGLLRLANTPSQAADSDALLAEAVRLLALSLRQSPQRANLIYPLLWEIMPMPQFLIALAPDYIPAQEALYQFLFTKDQFPACHQVLANIDRISTAALSAAAATTDVYSEMRRSRRTPAELTLLGMQRRIGLLGMQQLWEQRCAALEQLDQYLAPVLTQRLQQARELVAAQRWHQADLILADLQQIDPFAADVIVLHARIKHALGRNHEAERLLLSLLNSPRQLPLPLVTEAIALTAPPLRALPATTQRSQPFPSARFLQAALYLRRSQLATDPAVAAADLAVATAELTAIAAALDTGDVRTWLQAPLFWYTVAQAHERNADLSAAVAAYERALDSSPRHLPSADSLLRLVASHGISSRHILAAAALRQSLQPPAGRKLLPIDSQFGSVLRLLSIQVPDAAVPLDASTQVVYNWLCTGDIQQEHQFRKHFSRGSNLAFSQTLTAADTGHNLDLLTWRIGDVVSVTTTVAPLQLTIQQRRRVPAPGQYNLRIDIRNASASRSSYTALVDAPLPIFTLVSPIHD